MGQLGRQDIINENQRENGLKIIPFNKDYDLKAASYDITPTIIAMSSKLGMLETVYREKGNITRYYVYVKPKDTALVISNEYISVPPNIAGYVVSRVSRISDGFGHVSTNIDPNWEGALLIGLSNPTQKAIKVHVGGERGITTKADALATLSFHYLETPSNNPLDENIRGMRMDLLENIKYTERKGLKASISRIIHFKRCKYTDAFFDYIARNNLDKNNWEEIVQTLRGVSQDDTLTRFVVKETFIWRCIHWIENHINIVMIIIIIMLFILLKSGIIPENISKEILDGFDLYNRIKVN